MPRTRAIIEISASAMSLAVCRGRELLDSRSARFERGEWAERWPSQLDEMQPTLSKFVSELDCAGTPCEIVYHAPGAVIGVASCSQGAGASAALNAASLQIASTATFPLTANPFDVRELFKDLPGRSGTRAPIAAQFHTIAAADTDVNVRTLSTWAESAGLRVEGLTPYEAAATVAAVNSIASHPNPDSGAIGTDVIASVWIGGPLSVLAVGDGARLLFVRTIAIGTESLVEALTKPIRAAEASQADSSVQPRADVSLNRQQARSLLGEIGVPSPQTALPGLPGMYGSAVLPALQPPLQRLVIEIKQSLRFGVSDERRADVKLKLCGPGAAIPDLHATLARLVGCERTEGDSAAPPNDAATLEVFASHADRTPSFVGMQLGDRLATRRIRRAMALGVGAAAAFLVVSAFSAHAQLSKERDRLAAVQSCASGDKALAGLQTVSLDARAAAAALAYRVLHRMGAAPRWGPLMEAIADATPRSIKLGNIHMSAGDGPPGAAGTGSSADTPSCVLRGHVLLAQSTDAAGAIKHLADKLADVPLISGVRLGATSRSSVQGEQVQTFELTLTLVPVPFEAEYGRAQATGSDQP